MSEELTSIQDVIDFLDMRKMELLKKIVQDGLPQESAQFIRGKIAIIDDLRRWLTTPGRTSDRYVVE